MHNILILTFHIITVLIQNVLFSIDSLHISWYRFIATFVHHSVSLLIKDNLNKIFILYPIIARQLPQRVIMWTRSKNRLLFSIAVTLLLVGHVFAEEDEIDEEESVPHSVRVESCAGWRLNKLPEVKKFIQVKILHLIYWWWQWLIFQCSLTWL